MWTLKTSFFVSGFTPLILAATAGHVGVVEILLDNGADIEAQSERTKDTPLSLACSGGRQEVKYNSSLQKQCVDYVLCQYAKAVFQASYSSFIHHSISDCCVVKRKCREPCAF